ncbi:MAG: hypothetical protein ACR2QB_03990 [Gammaproteobacteria bacterium]
MNSQQVDISTIGNALENSLVRELGATPVAEFDNLQDLKNLAGESTGHVHVYAADKLVKASFLSIAVGPGRYFNIHLIPRPEYDVPRFVYEGLLMAGASQVSLDLFADMDAEARVLDLPAFYGDAVEVYNAARQNPALQLQASRFLHMRAFTSPLFLLVSRAPDSVLPDFEAYAAGYLDAWFKLLRDADEIAPPAVADREARRQHMADMLIKLDPDRDMVVQVYGEETIQAIEAASML